MQSSINPECGAGWEEFYDELGETICGVCGTVLEQTCVSAHRDARSKKLRTSDGAQANETEEAPCKKPTGPSPKGFSWDAAQGCWINAQGQTRLVGPSRYRLLGNVAKLSALPSNDPRPWKDWFMLMADRGRTPMSAAQALALADNDGLVLRRQDGKAKFSGVRAHRRDGKANSSGVKVQDQGHQAYVQVSTHFCHIAATETPEEAALHLARFCAYPLGLAAAEAQLLAAREDVTRARGEERERLKAEKAARKAELEAEKKKQARREAEREVKRQAEKAGKEAEKAAREAERKANVVAKAAAKVELAARQKLAGEMQRRLLREAAERQRQANSARAHEAAAGPSAAPADPEVMSEMQDEELAGQPVELLVQQALAACGPGSCPYRCLGLLSGAPHETVRKRYLALALRLHPDKLEHPRAGEAFAGIESAYRRLAAG